MDYRIPLTLLLTCLGSCSSTAEEGDGAPKRQLAVVRRQLLTVEAGRLPLEPGLRALCQDGQPTVRRLTVRTLGRSRDPAALEELLLLIRDPDRGVRIEAFRALTLLGPKGAALAVSALADRDPAIRLLATTLQGLYGQGNMVPSLLVRIEDEDHWVRGAAALSAGRLAKRGATTEGQRQQLQDALLARGRKEDSAEVRWRLAWAFTHLLPTGHLPIEELLRHWLDTGADWRVRLFAARGLSRITAPNKDTRDALRDGTLDPVRAVAIECLQVLYLPGYPNLPRHPAAPIQASGSALTPADRETLDQALNAKRTQIRQAACACLGHRPELDQGALFKALADPEAVVRGSAIIALTRRSPGRFAAMLPEFADDDPWQVRRAVAWAAVLARKGIGLEVLRTLARDGDPRVRHAVAMSLAITADLGPGTDLAKELLVDFQPQVVSLAATLLARLRPHNLEEPLAVAWGRTRGVPALFPVRRVILEVLNRAAIAAPSALERRLRAEATVDAVAVVRRLASPVPDASPSPPSRRPNPALAPPPEAGDIPAPDTVISIKTAKGILRLRLDSEQAPLHAALWARLARDGSLKGRVVHGVDPTFGIKAFGGAMLGPVGVDAEGRMLADEISWQPVSAGTVLTSNIGGQDSGGDSLFICLVPCPNLEGKVTVLGRLDPESLAVAGKLEEGDKILAARLSTP